MRTFEYIEPGGERGETYEKITITDEEILAIYWNHWKSLMVSKFGPDHELITKENCIDDFVVVHWAYEV